MRNTKNKEVKHSELFLAYDRLVTDQGMTMYWKKVKGYSQNPGPDKDGNDEADHLAKLGVGQGTAWEFQYEWLATSQTCVVNAITRRQAREKREDAQTFGQTLRLGRKPDDADLVTMQERDPAIQAIRQLITNPPTQGPSQSPPAESKELHALRRDQAHLKLEKGLLVYSHNGQGPARWVVPTDHRGGNASAGTRLSCRGPQGL